MAHREDIRDDLMRAEKLEFDHENNRIVAKYQDTSEVEFSDVRVYWPDVVRAMHKRGLMTRQQALKELRKLGLKLKPSKEEPIDG